MASAIRNQRGILIALAIRDSAILVGGGIIRMRTGRILASMWSGKVAVTAVAITASAALLRADAPVLTFCLWASAVLLAYSFIRYMVRFFSIISASGKATDSPA